VPHLKFSILTDPIPLAKKNRFEILKKVLRLVKYTFLKRPLGSHPFFRGHISVTRSLLEGLQKLGISFNYNPYFTYQLEPVAIVLAGVYTLEQAIYLKRKGKIKKLIAGPNIIVFSSDYNNLIASPEIDLVITPADIVNQLYILDNPSLKGKIVAWPAGVDTDYFKPNLNTIRNQILIFEKQNKGPVGPIQPYINFLIFLGYNVKIIQYGNYKIEQYRDELQNSIIMLGFVTDESQGIAWAEAWSSDVPTFIWNNHLNVYRGRSYLCSTAPYLTDENGIFFDDFYDFQIKFKQWEQGHFRFQPRKWCVENMSDEVCAKKLLDIIQSVHNK